MLLAALAATISVTLFAEQQRWTRAVEHRRDQVQAQALVFAGIQWARQILNEDARLTLIDHLGEPWAISLPPIPLENGEIRGSITDAQARLNVNALAGTDAATAVERDAHRAAVRAARRPRRGDRCDRRLDRRRRRRRGRTAPRTPSTPRVRFPASRPMRRWCASRELAHVPGMTLGGAGERRAVPRRAARRDAAQREHGVARGPRRRRSARPATTPWPPSWRRARSGRSTPSPISARGCREGVVVADDTSLARAQRLLSGQRRSPAGNDDRAGPGAGAPRRRRAAPGPRSSGRSSSERRRAGRGPAGRPAVARRAVE